MDFSLVLETWPIYLDGLWTTVWLVASALVIGLLVAVPVAVARNAQFPLWRYPAWAFIYFFRGTPLLIQLYLIYYGLSQVVNVEDSLWQHAWFCALVAFVLNTAAYTAEIIRGAINGLPKGEVEAERSQINSVVANKVFKLTGYQCRKKAKVDYCRESMREIAWSVSTLT